MHSSCAVGSTTDVPTALLAEMAVFAKVVELRSLSAAARQLGVTSSAVSRSVTRLEAQMGAQLLHRSTRAVSPTDLGRQVYAGCASIAQTARDVCALAGQHVSEPTGRLLVTAPVGLGQRWLVPRLFSFLERWPNVSVGVTLTDRLVDVVEEGFDLALRITTALPQGLVARPLLSTSYVLVASPDYVARHGAPQAPGELAAHRCIVLGYGDFTGDLTLFQAATSARVKVKVSGPLTVNNGVAILSAVEAGLGIGLLPDFTARVALESGAVVKVLAEWSLGVPYEERKVHALYAPTRHVPRKVRALIDHLVEASAPANSLHASQT
jgi:DNA-binding transcriptional LysR family regulator